MNWSRVKLKSPTSSYLLLHDTSSSNLNFIHLKDASGLVGLHFLFKSIGTSLSHYHLSLSR